jgi:hypothetical protein
MNDNIIINSLNLFEPIGLDGIENVRLMNRVETKYLFPVKKLEDLFSLLVGKYKILEIDNLRAFPYLTTYLDTPDSYFYYQHVRGELERYKIRFRKYEATGTSYLEIKKKTNKSRTEKLRILNNHISDSFDDHAINFIKAYSPVSHRLLKPVLYSSYKRVTAIGLESNERITIDFDISFCGLTSESKVKIPFLAIAELKSADYTRSAPFKSLIKNLKIYPSGISKYCFGNSLIYDSLKKNMMKPKLLLIKKIENEFIISNSN